MTSTAPRAARRDHTETLAVLRGGPDVHSAVVTEVADEGAPLVVGYVAGPDPALGSGPLRQYLAGQLPDYLIPDRLVVLPALPLTADGDFDLAALPAPDEVVDGVEAPQTPTEKALAEIFADLLGVPGIGVHDSFFALGGSSILATRLAARMREAFPVELDLIDVLAAPTIDELAQLLREHGIGT